MGSACLERLDEVAEFFGYLFLRLHGLGDFLADCLAEFLPHAVDGDFDRHRADRRRCGRPPSARMDSPVW